MSVFSDLENRQERVKAAIKIMDGPPLPLVTSSMERLNYLMAEAEPILKVVLPVEPSGQLLPATIGPDHKESNGRAKNG